MSKKIVIALSGHTITSRVSSIAISFQKAFLGAHVVNILEGSSYERAMI